MKLEEQDSLIEEWMKGMLSLHSTLGSMKFAAKQHEVAYVHLRCLELCQQGEEALRETLKKYSFPFRLKPQDERLVKIKTAAADALDDIGSGLVREATKIAEDADAIGRLPQGIRKNYQGGIQHLDVFIKLDIPVGRVLRQSLEWYNDWCYDLYLTQQLKELKNLIKPASAVANQLIPLCVKSRVSPENAALSQHFLFKGFAVTAEDPQQATKEYQEAVAWYSGNENAKKLLGDAYRAIIMKQLDGAVEQMKKENYSNAYEILDSVEKQLPEDDSTGRQEVKETRALVCFRHAEMLANDGKFSKALEHSLEAQKLAPNQPAIKQLVKEMEEYAPEENNLRNLKNAREAMDRGNHEQAIQHAAKVSSKSKFYQNACRIQSGAYFHLAISLANNQQDFAKALDKMERALELNSYPEDRNVIAQQLEQLKQAKVGHDIRQACDRKDWAEAEEILHSEMAENRSGQYGQFLRQQLAAVLNVHAVELLNGVQQAEKKFADAVNDIMNSVRQQPGVG
ncbi:hypothetical protein HUU05_08495 [candidate division KSB1 bacterium]|nr:hypothetical protein [candidate division KSB1 bacterium]